MIKRFLILSLILLSTFSVWAQSTHVPFFDGFDNNKNGWLTKNDGAAAINVSGGSYNFKYKKTDGWTSYRPFDLDQNKDFKIETLIVKKSGVTDYGYGLLWGQNSAGDNYSFNITSSGYYRISKSVGGKFSTFVDWTKSDAIKTGNGPYNILIIKKIGQTIEFYINKVKVKSLNFSDFFGNQIGFVVYNKQEVDFNYLSIYYLNKTPQPVVQTESKIKVPFFDGFENNNNQWSVKNNTVSNIKISGGDLIINHLQSSDFEEIHKPFDLDPYKNFYINTMVEKTNGVNGYGYGLYWGSKDMDNRFTFLISDGGQYTIYKKVDGKVNYLQSWGVSDAIKKGNNASNILSVRKVDGNYNFYINDTFVKSIPFESFYGNKIGYIVFNKQQVNVHYLSIYYPKSPKPPVVVNNNNNNNGDDNYQRDVIFEDSFNSNANNWSVLSNSNVELQFKNGGYDFNHKRENNGWTTSKSVKIDESKDYEIETTLNKISGIQNNGYGLIWGRKDSDNEFEYFISPDGSFYIKYFEDGKAHIIKSWTTSSYINKGNGATNTLKVQKIGDVINYYINGHYVYKSDAKSFFGDYLGFIIYQRQEINIKNVKVSYLSKKVDNSNDLFYDDFANNNNSWSTSNAADYSASISGGKYYFEHKKSSGGWSTSIDKYFDEDKDYEIETKIEKINGIKDNGYGIMWGRKSAGNYFEFVVSANGLYSVDRLEDGKRADLIPWTTSSYIDSKENTLTIKKQGSIVKFYINGNYVNQINNKPFLGSRIGFIIYDKQKIAVDYVRVKYLENVVKPNVVVDTNYPFSDDFSSNKHSWATGNTSKYDLNFSNGFYNFEYKSNAGYSSTLRNDIDQTKNFEISADIKKVSGVNNYGFGLSWGRKDSNNQFNFMISGDGSYKIKKMDQGDSKLIQDWTESNAINKGNGATNTLSIRKNNNTLNFYINNSFVTSKEFEPFYGNRMGFVVFANQKIAIDNLTVKYLETDIDNNPPTIVITEPEVVRGFKIVKAKRITVRGKATDSDGVYNVTVNGIDASLQADGSFVAQVPLRVGDNDLNVKATDLKYNSSITKFKIKRDVTPVVIVDPNDNNNNIKVIKTDGGTFYALLIGVSDYDDSKIVSLDGMPTTDIQNLSDALTGYYTFDPTNVEMLVNPTRSKIIRAFDRLSKKVTPKDNLLIFYAGHGTFNNDDKLGYWLPSDAEADYTDNWINNAVVRDNIKRIKSKHTLLISDACFSGSIFKTRDFSIKNASLSIQKKYELPSRKAMTSGTLKTVPNVSVFMKYLLERLETNKDPYLSAGQLFNRIEAPVGNNSPNTPQFGTIQDVGDEGGDFIFIRKN